MRENENSEANSSDDLDETQAGRPQPSDASPEPPDPFGGESDVMETVGSISAIDEEVQKRIESRWQQMESGERVDESFSDSPPELRSKLLRAWQFRKMAALARDRAAAEDRLLEQPASQETQDHRPLGGDEAALRIRCPQCHTRIRIVEENAPDFSDITCDSCGSHFALVDTDPMETKQAGAIKTLAHFDLIEPLGRGAFGVVWKARDRELDRTVAVKVPRNNFAGEHSVEMFLREARAAAQLRHPNVVTVHEVGRVEDQVYIVSDFITGIPLDKWLNDRKVTPNEAAVFCCRVAEALHSAHECGVIHRDLKPANILVNYDSDRNLVPHITDFGLARRETEVTMTIDGKIIGTPNYMPPEQASGHGHNADARSDVYSLGVILFELMTEALPFRGMRDALLFQVINDEPPAPRTLNSRIPRDLETICLKCLQKAPEQRYQTAKQLADDLKRFLDGKPILARPVGRIERLLRWCRRNPVVATLSVLLFLTLAVGASVSTYFAIESLDRAEKLAGSNKEIKKQNAEISRINTSLLESSSQLKKSLAEEQRLTKQLRVQTQKAIDSAAVAEKRAKELELERKRVENSLQIVYKLLKGIETGRVSDLDDAYSDILQTGLTLPDEERDALRPLFLALVDLKEADQLLEPVPDDNFFKQAARKTQAARKLATALENLKQATESAPQLGLPWLLQAQIRDEILRQPPATVLPDWNKAVELLPDASAAHSGRGFCFKKQKQWDEARADLQKAIELDPQNEYGYFGLAGVAFHQKDYPVAIKNYQTALRLPRRFSTGPNWKTVVRNDLFATHWNYGSQLSTEKKYNDAISQFLSAVEHGDTKNRTEAWPYLIHWITVRSVPKREDDPLAKIDSLRKDKAPTFQLALDLLALARDVQHDVATSTQIDAITKRLSTDQTLKAELAKSFFSAWEAWCRESKAVKKHQPAIDELNRVLLGQ